VVVPVVGVGEVLVGVGDERVRVNVAVRHPRPCRLGMIVVVVPVVV
jgi:hypothetical protein